MPRPKKRSTRGLLAIVNRGNSRLTQIQKELVVQTYFLKGSYCGTSRELGITVATVKRIIDEANQQPELMAARTRALDQIAGKVAGITEQVIDSITPEEIQTRVHEVRDAEGKLKRVVTTGPSLRDKGFFIGILTDKQKVLADARAVIHGQDTMDMGRLALSLPDTVEEAKRLIVQKAKRLRVYTEITFKDDAPEIQKGLTKAGITDDQIDEAELVLAGEDPFD